MKKPLRVLIGCLICIIAVILFRSSHQTKDEIAKPIHPAPHKASSPNTTFPTITSSQMMATAHSSHLDQNRDYLLWGKLNDELEATWEKEIFGHIQYIDRENAQDLYRAYSYERTKYLADEELSLTSQLNDLSRLNGESVEDPKKFENPEMLQDEFITALRRIFRQHYGFIEDQRKIFLDAHKNE